MDATTQPTMMPAILCPSLPATNALPDCTGDMVDGVTRDVVCVVVEVRLFDCAVDMVDAAVKLTVMG